MSVKKVVQIKGTIPWDYFRDRSQTYWIATCDSLKLTVQAETWDELHETISQTVNALFSDLLETGDLEDFLKEHGWQPTEPLPEPEAQRDRGEEFKFDIPWIVNQAANDSPTAFHH